MAVPSKTSTEKDARSVEAPHSSGAEKASRTRSTLLFMSATALEEDIDELCQRAGALGLLGTPMFLFQEGRDQKAERAFTLG